MNRNELKSLPTGVFDSLTKLTRLDLDQNQLQSNK
uniref:Variable lymphocyte receptor A cassette n=1 Tax=Petromyzon marinus TaxID=7757 RepID=S4S0E9_PETMA